MSISNQDKTEKKEAMKALRIRRKTYIENAAAKMKIQKKAIDAVTARLKEHAQTVPELSAATGIPGAETLWYVATLKKYGVIKEADKDGSYFKYELVEAVSTPASE